MFEHLTKEEQLRIEREQNMQLQEKLARAVGDLEYIAMMADIDLGQEEVEPNE